MYVQNAVQPQVAAKLSIISKHRASYENIFHGVFFILKNIIVEILITYNLLDDAYIFLIVFM